MQPPLSVCEETMLGNADEHYLSLTLYDHRWMRALLFPTTAAASEQALLLGPDPDPDPDPDPEPDPVPQAV